MIFIGFPQFVVLMLGDVGGVMSWFPRAAKWNMNSRDLFSKLRIQEDESHEFSVLKIDRGN